MLNNRFASSVCAVVCLAAAPVSAYAGVSFTDHASFLAALNPGHLSEDFEARVGEVYAAPLAISNGTFSASLSTSAQALLVFDKAGDDYLTTSINTTGFSAPITIAFTSGNVTAFGGNFFVESAFGAVVPETVTLTFSDGSVFPLSAQTTSSFFGYVGDAPLASVSISPNASHRFVGLDDLCIGSSPIPAPACASLLAIAAGASAARRRRAL